MITVYAAIQRGTPDPVAREKAQGAARDASSQARAGVDVPRAQLELGRLLVEIGDLRNARNAFAEAMRNGNYEARLEHALLLIEDRDPPGGRATLDALLKDVGVTATSRQLLEGARARMLDGEHPGALLLLDQAEKIVTVEKWQLERERARLALPQGRHRRRRRAARQRTRELRQGRRDVPARR